LASIKDFYKSRPDLNKLLAVITGPNVGCSVVRKEIFFVYESSFEGRTKLHSWAFANGWTAVETRLPPSTKRGKSTLMTNSGEMMASLADIITHDVVKHVFLVTNDLSIEPMLRWSRRNYDLTFSLIYPHNNLLFPYNSLSSNVDEILDPLTIPSFIGDD